MKNFLILLCFLSILAACSQDSSQTEYTEPVPTTLAGTVTNAASPNIILTNDIDRYNIMLENGGFNTLVDLKTPGFYTIYHGRDKTTIFLSPGKELKITTQGNGFTKNMTFEGEIADENEHLAQIMQEERQKNGLKRKDYVLPENEFITAMKERKDSDTEDLIHTAKTQDFDLAYRELLETEILYEWATDRIVYPLYHAFYNKIEDFEVSEGYHDFLKGLEYDDGKLLSSNKFKGFVTNLIDLKAKEVLEEQPELKIKDNGTVLTKFNLAKETFKDPEILDFIMFQALKQHIRYEGANGTPELLSIFEKSCTNEKYKKEIQADFSNWANLTAGQAAPTFNYADINGKIYGLENFSGKYVYIDIWATWCGPCRKEIPHLEELQETYKDNDKIVFTSISIDQDTDAWRKMVKDKNMKGVQLLADGAWQSKIVMDYKISGIPRFLLIDPEGNIISAHAARPSSEKIKAQLAGFLES